VSFSKKQIFIAKINFAQFLQRGNFSMQIQDGFPHFKTNLRKDFHTLNKKIIFLKRKQHFSRRLTGEMSHNHPEIYGGETETASRQLCLRTLCIFTCSAYFCSCFEMFLIFKIEPVFA